MHLTYIFTKRISGFEQDPNNDSVLFYDPTPMIVLVKDLGDSLVLIQKVCDL